MDLSRRYRRLVLGIISSSLCVAPQVIAVECRADAPLKLEDAVHQALSNNERAKKAPLRAEQAHGSLERARGAFFPTLVAGGTASYRPEEEKDANRTSVAGTVTLSQPIIAPSAFPLYAQAKSQLESDRWGMKQDLRVLAFDTARAFITALAQESVLEAAKRRLDKAKANLENAQARAQAQLSGTNDATRAAIDLTSSQREVALAEASTARAYLQLGLLVGKPVTSTLVAPEHTMAAAAAFEKGSPNAVNAALERRPDVRSSHERTEALRASAREPLYRLAPTLSGTAQLRLIPSPAGNEKLQDITLGLNLGWTIFDAGFRYADRTTRVAQAESQALDEKLLRRTVDVDVNVALVNLRAARETVRIADEAIAAAQKNLEETDILYKQGLARAIELTDANARRYDAEVSRAAARLNMEQAYLELRNALGFGPLEEEGEKP